MMAVLSDLIHLLFPRTCVVCGEVLMSGETFLCSMCLNVFPLNDGVDEEADEIVAENLEIEHFYWLFRYDRASDFHRLIHSIKYHSNGKLAEWAGTMLGERIKNLVDIDCIIPVPLHPQREKERGFNQAFLIGKGMANSLGVRVESRVLKRVINTRSQTGLASEMRSDNVAQAFALMHEVELEGCHVLLVDDVMTSGATVRACMTELKKIKNLRVSVACLGKSGSI